MTTNEQIVIILMEQILPQLRQVDNRLATLNGHVERNVARLGEHDVVIADVQAQYAQCTQVIAGIQATLKEREKRYNERRVRQNQDIAEGKASTKAILAKIWEIGLKVAELGAVIGFIIALVLKFAGKW